MPIENATLAARVAALTADERDTPAPAEQTEQQPEQTEQQSGTQETAPPDPEAEIRAKRLELFEEKLARQREERKAARLAERAAEDRRQAEEDRKAAATEREALAEGRKDFRKFFQANGMDAREAFQEMTRQAIEADTPEAKIRAMQESWKAEIETWKAELAKEVDPLKEEVQRLREEKAEVQARARNQMMLSTFREAREDKSFIDVRAEYGDEAIFNLIADWDKNPESFYEAAKTYGVALQDPAKGFSMREAFELVKVVHDLDQLKRNERRAQFLPKNESPAGQEQPAQQSPTVNGTTERRNAGLTITNDLASSSSSAGRTLSREERVEAIKRRLDPR